MVPNGREVIVGATRTAQFGMVIMFGIGGSYVESLDAVAFRVPPLGSRDMDHMIEQSGAGRLLSTRRGQPAADIAALRAVISRLSAIAESGLDVDQIEINPLLVLDEGQGALAVDALVLLRDEHSAAGVIPE